MMAPSQTLHCGIANPVDGVNRSVYKILCKPICLHGASLSKRCTAQHCEEDMSLSDKVILVSGANRGIGAAVVRELLKARVKKIYAGARNLDSLPDFGDSRIVPLQLDVTKDESVRKAAEAAADIDVLVNNAGTMAFGDWIASAQEAIEADM